MKKLILIVPFMGALVSCEKEELVKNETNQPTLISTEQVNLNAPENEIQSNNKTGNLAYDKYSCLLEGDPENKPSGTKCVGGTIDDCHTDATTRCASSTAFHDLVGLHLTPVEADLFWRKTYNAQFVHNNWDFFMAGYNMGALNHPDDILRNL